MSMKVLQRLLPALGVIALLAGCATSGPEYKEMSQGLAVPPAGKQRIWVYRSVAAGSAIVPDPDAHLNDELGAGRVLLRRPRTGRLHPQHHHPVVVQQKLAFRCWSTRLRRAKNWSRCAIPITARQSPQM
jgi:hypothetical protein